MSAAARLRAGLAVALFAATAAVYGPALGHDWLNYDDDIYVLANPMVQAGITADSVRTAFTTFHSSNWYPLTQLSWMLDAELHGLDARAFHATNVLLHALAAAVLFVALARLTRSDGRSAFAAGVFALHPLHVESVAWIASRKDPLAGLFFALALLLYERWVRQGRPLALQLALLACLALGLMAKQVLVTLPFVLLILDAWPLGRLSQAGRIEPSRLRAAVAEKLPAFALVAVFCALAFVAQSRGGTIATSAELPMAARVANAIVSYAVYLRQAVWPTDLAVYYPHQGATPLPAVLGSLALLALITAVCARAWRSLPALGVGWLWYGVMLAPVIGLVQLGSQAHADRYTYLPLIGLAIAAAWGAPALAARVGVDRRVVAAAGVAALAALAVATSFQLRHWRDSAALFERAIAVTGGNPVAHAHLGAARLSQGRPAEAAAQWREALRLQPDFGRVANNLAWLLATSPDESLRRPDDAVRLAERANEENGGRDPGVLDTLAAAYASARRYEEAIRTQKRAVALLGETGGDASVAEFESRLSLYRAGRPYRQPDVR